MRPRQITNIHTTLSAKFEHNKQTIFQIMQLLRLGVINKCTAVSAVINRDSRKSRPKNGKKTRQTFVKIAKITAKSRQRHGIKSRAQKASYSL